MKKGYILAAVVLMSAFSRPASAQQFRFGIEAGGTISTSSWDLSSTQKKKSVGGFTVGITGEYEIFDNTWLQSGLSFETKGAKYKVGRETVQAGVLRDRTESYRPMYVRIPITVAYKFNLTDRIRFFVAGGGFLAQGIGGEYNYTYKYIQDGGGSRWEDENESKSVFSTGALKRFDCGLNLGGGFEFGKLVLRVGYDWSLIDIVKDKTKLKADEFKNRSLAIVAGLKF